MTFLKTIFWVIVAVIVALVWISTPRVDIPLGTNDADGLILNGRLGTFLIATFLIGFLPLYLYHRTVKWRLKRRVKTLEAQVATHNRTIATQAEARAEEQRAAAIADDRADTHATAHDTAAAAKAELMPAPQPVPAPKDSPA